MSFSFANVKTRVEQNCDGRAFSESQHSLWANEFRKEIAMDTEIAGFHGLYFLYKTATVSGGSVLNQKNYAIPDDFIQDLDVYYDGKLLLKDPARLTDLVQNTEPTDASASDSNPTWVRMQGVEFSLYSAPPDAKKEIKLIYCALPGEVPASSNDNFVDYFLNHFLTLHVMGITEKAAIQFMMNTKLASYYEKKVMEERRRLMLHNRRHWMGNSRIRFMTWTEFQEKKTLLYPQFGNV